MIIARMKHVLTAQQFDPDLIKDLCQRADEFEKLLNKKDYQKLRKFEGRLMFSMFFEPSTRTRMSFSAAAQHLGLEVVSTENAREFSSAAKGESLEDTIKNLCQYHGDLIVMRHFENEAASRAAKVSTVPIINAGDGGGQHPTQALLDLYTIQKELGHLDNLTVAIGTDLMHSRTARSLSYMLASYPGNHLIFVSPKELKIGDDIKDYLKSHGTTYEETDQLEEALRKADVIYWNRIQKERFTGKVPPQAFTITTKHLKLIKPRALIMNPLPRIDEIAVEVDDDPRAIYFRQAGNGMLIRMALIDWILS